VTEIGLFDAIYSARALRHLKPDAVPDEVITRIACGQSLRLPSISHTWSSSTARVHRRGRCREVH
jgi:hypothetical protein